jgi:hypothetical protein
MSEIKDTDIEFAPGMAFRLLPSGRIKLITERDGDHAVPQHVIDDLRSMLASSFARRRVM